MRRIMLSMRGWNPAMWVGLTGISAITTSGANNETIIGASIMFVSGCALAFLAAAAVVCTFK